MRRLAYIIVAVLVADVLAWAVFGKKELPAAPVEAWPEWEYVDPGDSLIVYPGIVLGRDSLTVRGLSKESVNRVFNRVRDVAGHQVDVRFEQAVYRVGSGTALSYEGYPGT